jgi:hypothetical protein
MATRTMVLFEPNPVEPIHLPRPVSLVQTRLQHGQSWVQGAMLEPLFEPVYLNGVVVGGVQETGPKDEVLRKLIKPEIQRAIWGRIEQMQGEYFLPYHSVY